MSEDGGNVRWKVEYNKGIFNPVRNISPGKENIFSCYFKKTLKYEAENAQQPNGELDHLIVKIFKEYQAIMTMFKYELMEKLLLL